MLLSKSTLKQLFRECLIDKFCNYLEQFTKTSHFCRFTDRRLYTGCSTKVAAHSSFNRAL